MRIMRPKLRTISTNIRQFSLETRSQPPYRPFTENCWLLWARRSQWPKSYQRIYLRRFTKYITSIYTSGACFSCCTCTQSSWGIKGNGKRTKKKKSVSIQSMLDDFFSLSLKRTRENNRYNIPLACCCARYPA